MHDAGVRYGESRNCISGVNGSLLRKTQERGVHTEKEATVTYGYIRSRRGRGNLKHLTQKES